jgi:ribosomal protein S18 acetylase RimI-like enzyme
MTSFCQLIEPTPDELQALAGLYRDAGWWAEASEHVATLQRIVSGSHCFWVARSAGKIVAMGRAISDRVSDAYIQDVTVAGTHRHCGIGRGIVKAIVDHLRADGLSWIGLIAERGSHGLYEPLGFRRMPDAAPMLLIIE